MQKILCFCRNLNMFFKNLFVYFYVFLNKVIKNKFTKSKKTAKISLFEVFIVYLLFFLKKFFVLGKFQLQNRKIQQIMLLWLSW